MHAEGGSCYRFLAAVQVMAALPTVPSTNGGWNACNLDRRAETISSQQPCLVLPFTSPALASPYCKSPAVNAVNQTKTSRCATAGEEGCYRHGWHAHPCPGRAKRGSLALTLPVVKAHLPWICCKLEMKAL